MAIPTLSASLDKQTYAPGEPMTLTVTYGDADNRTFEVTVSVSDGENSSAPVVIPVTISDVVTVSVADSEGRVWTKVSDTGTVAVLKAVA